MKQIFSNLIAGLFISLGFFVGTFAIDLIYSFLQSL